MWSYYTVETFKRHADDEQNAAHERGHRHENTEDAVPVLIEWHVIHLDHPSREN